MISAIAISLTGLNAAAQRIGVAANNIANARNTVGIEAKNPVYDGYKPVSVIQQAIEGGGVKTAISEIDPPYVTAFDPSGPVAGNSGLIAFPNVDFAEQFADISLARHAFMASLNTIRAADDMVGALLDNTA